MLACFSFYFFFSSRSRSIFYDRHNHLVEVEVLFMGGFVHTTGFEKWRFDTQSHFRRIIILSHRSPQFNAKTRKLIIFVKILIKWGNPFQFLSV